MILSLINISMLSEWLQLLEWLDRHVLGHIITATTWAIYGICGAKNPDVKWVWAWIVFSTGIEVGWRTQGAEWIWIAAGSGVVVGMLARELYKWARGQKSS
jgi:hypothetical protein